MDSDRFDALAKTLSTTATRRGFARFISMLARAFALVVLVLATASALFQPLSAPVRAAAACDVVASVQGNDNNDGTANQPVRTVAKLASMLDPGETGCLTSGQTFFEIVTVRQSGAAGNPITITSTPGGRATFTGQMRVTGDHVVLRDLDFRGLGAVAQDYPKTYHLGVDGDDVTVTGNVITSPHGICVDVGNVDAYAGPNDPNAVRADDFVLDRNRIFGCGMANQLDPQRDSGVHGIYIINAGNARITNNYVYDNAVRGIQLWPTPQGTLIAHNVIDGNSGNLNLGSWAENGYYSRDTTVRDNIISHATYAFPKDEAQVFGNFPNDGQSRGNLVIGNCLVHAEPATNFGGYGYEERDNTTASADATLFIDRTAKDFRVRDGSLCAGKGPQTLPPDEDGGDGGNGGGGNEAPTITNMRPSKSTRDRTPTIRATVRDAETELTESDIQLFLDGAEIGTDQRGYDDPTVGANVLFHTPEGIKLKRGKHTVKVIATDADGKTTMEQWTFKIVR